MTPARNDRLGDQGQDDDARRHTVLPGRGRAIVTREGSSWLADIPAVPGAHTFARSQAGLAKFVREVIILMAWAVGGQSGETR